MVKSPFQVVNPVNSYESPVSFNESQDLKISQVELLRTSAHLRHIGLVFLGQSQPETMVFTTKTQGFPVNVPLNQSIEP